MIGLGAGRWVTEAPCTGEAGLVVVVAAEAECEMGCAAEWAGVAGIVAAPARATVAFAADADTPFAAWLCELASEEPEEIRATAAAAFERAAAAADRFAVLAAGALGTAVRAAAAAAAKPDTVVDGGPLVRPEVANPVGLGTPTSCGFPGALRAAPAFAGDPCAAVEPC